VLTQPLQCGVVADFLALSIDRLGSLLVQLKRRRVIEETPGALRLTDIAALETLAGTAGIRDYRIQYRATSSHWNADENKFSDTGGK
jgi:hypothetical protein